MADRFRVRFTVEIQKHDEHGYPSHGDRLTTTEEFHVDLSSFTEIAAVLGQFHALAETVKAEVPPVR